MNTKVEPNNVKRIPTLPLVLIVETGRVAKLQDKISSRRYDT